MHMCTQIMAESADACMRALLANCQTTRAIPALVQLLTKDKNAKVCTAPSLCPYAGPAQYLYMLARLAIQPWLSHILTCYAVLCCAVDPCVLLRLPGQHSGVMGALLSAQVL